MRQGIRGLLVVAAFAGAAGADEVTLRNGDVLHGTIGRADRGKLAFTHASGLAMELPLDAIRALASDGPLVVRFAGGSRLLGRIGPGPHEGALRVQAAEPGAMLLAEIDFTRLDGLGEPIPAPVAAWSGTAAVGATVFDGNTRAQTFFGRFQGQRRSLVDLMEATAGYNYAETRGVPTTRSGASRMQYNHVLLAPSYLYVGAGLEYDRFRALNLRAPGGAGLGVEWLDRPEVSLRTEGGIEYVNEDLRNTPDRRFPAARAACTFECRPAAGVKLREFAELVPNLEKGSDFVFRSETTLDLDLWKGFGLGLALIVDYDEQPPPTARHRADTQYKATFTYTFG